MLYYLGLGANLGEPLRQLREAVDAIGRLAVRPPRVSPVVVSPPWDGSDQPDYYNLAMEAELPLAPRDLLRRLQQIEAALGRPADHARWAARTIDIDILLAPGVQLDEPALSIPHPHLRERLFVLQPLAALAPDLRDPTTGDTIATLRDRLAAAPPGPLPEEPLP